MANPKIIPKICMVHLPALYLFDPGKPEDSADNHYRDHNDESALIGTGHIKDEVERGASHKSADADHGLDPADKGSGILRPKRGVYHGAGENLREEVRNAHQDADQIHQAGRRNRESHDTNAGEERADQSDHRFAASKPVCNGAAGDHGDRVDQEDHAEDGADQLSAEAEVGHVHGKVGVGSVEAHTEEKENSEDRIEIVGLHGLFQGDARKLFLCRGLAAFYFISKARGDPQFFGILSEQEANHYNDDDHSNGDPAESRGIADVADQAAYDLAAEGAAQGANRHGDRKKGRLAFGKPFIDQGDGDRRGEERSAHSNQKRSKIEHKNIGSGGVDEEADRKAETAEYRHVLVLEKLRDLTKLGQIQGA